MAESLVLIFRFQILSLHLFLKCFHLVTHTPYKQFLHPFYLPSLHIHVPESCQREKNK